MWLYIGEDTRYPKQPFRKFLIFWYRSIAAVDAVYRIVEEHADQV